MAMVERRRVGAARDRAPEIGFRPDAADDLDWDAAIQFFVEGGAPDHPGIRPLTLKHYREQLSNRIAAFAEERGITGVQGFTRPDLHAFVVWLDSLSVLNRDGTRLSGLRACARARIILPYGTSGRHLRVPFLLVEGVSVQVIRTAAALMVRSMVLSAQSAEQQRLRHLLQSAGVGGEVGELARLRDENRRLKSENRILKARDADAPCRKRYSPMQRLQILWHMVCPSRARDTGPGTRSLSSDGTEAPLNTQLQSPLHAGFTGP